SFFFQAEDGIRDFHVTGVQTCALPILNFPPTPGGPKEMSLINTPIKPFKAQAYKDRKFIEISDADLKGKWSVFFFYPADFTFVRSEERRVGKECRSR